LNSPYWDIDRTYYNKGNSPLDTGKYLNSFAANGTTFPFNAAKFYKEQWHRVPKLKGYDNVVWMDGTMEVTSNTFAVDIIAHLDKKQASHKDVVSVYHSKRGNGT
jgi:hypothetical protein